MLLFLISAFVVEIITRSTHIFIEFTIIPELDAPSIHTVREMMGRVEEKIDIYRHSV